MAKIWKVLPVFLLVFYSFSTIQGQFGPQPIYVGIPTMTFRNFTAAQLQDEWCWAASTQMILTYYGIPVTQPEIVARVFGGVIDWSASDQVISAALNGWGRTRNGQAVHIASQAHPGPPPVNLLITELSQGHPILLTFVTGPTSGHAVVMTAVSYINSPLGPQLTSIVLRDPWPSPQNIATAGRVEVPYTALAQFAATMRGYWLVRVGP
jgi:hypothetical protein